MEYSDVLINPKIAPTIREEHHNCLDVHYNEPFKQHKEYIKNIEG